MNISVTPPARIVTRVRAWLLDILAAEELNSRTSFPCGLYLFVDGRNVAIYAGVWENLTENFYIGQESNEARGQNFHILDKIQILIAIATWARIINEPEILDAVTAAFSREWLKSYNSIFNGLIYSNEPIQALGFSKAGQVAARFGEGAEAAFYDIHSQQIEVSGPDWSVIEAPVAVTASAVPATPDPEADIAF